MANIFYAFAFIIVEAYSGGIVILISTVRCVEIYFLEKKNLKEFKYSIILYSFAYCFSTLLLWQNFYDIIPLIASIVFTFAFAITDLQKFRYTMLFPNIILLGYSLIHHTYTSALLDCLEIIILMVAIHSHNISKDSTLIKNQIHLNM